MATGNAVAPHSKTMKSRRLIAIFIATAAKSY